AEMMIEQLGPASGVDTFGYNRASVEWVEGFIDRQRKTGLSGESTYTLVQVLGSFLGECLVRVYGGVWRKQGDAWGVFFDDRNNAAFPFAKVNKVFSEGLEGGESVLGFFDAVPAIFDLPSRNKEN